MFTGFQRVSALAAGSGTGVTIIAHCCQRQKCMFSGCFLKTLTVAEFSKKDRSATSQVLKSEMKKTQRGVHSDKTLPLIACYLAEA